MVEGETDDWRWTKFKEMANQVRKIRQGPARNAFVESALLLSKSLKDSKFPLRSAEIFDEFTNLEIRFLSYLDGEFDSIAATCKDYFIHRHGKFSLTGQFDFKVYPKKAGIQTGVICEVFEGNKRSMFHVKTHQHGPTINNSLSVQKPDAKELFIYKYLEILGFGPHCHFIAPITGSNRTIYIATEHIEFTDLDKLGMSYSHFQPLLELDLISRILCLTDCTTNNSNCGLNGQNPAIIDFRIEAQSDYAKPDILDRYLSGNGEYNYSGLMGCAIALSDNDKIDLLKSFINTRNPRAHITEAQQYVSHLISEMVGLISCSDFDLYLTGISLTLSALEAFSN